MSFSDQLANKGVARLQYLPAIRSRVAEVESLWERVCELPTEVKQALPYLKDAKVSGVGYEPPREGGEQKENAHIRRAQAEILLANARQSRNEVLLQFTEAALELPDVLMPVVQHIGESLEEHGKMPGFARDLVESRDDLLFRFLHYLPSGKAGKEIAEPHTDKGGMTMHLFETCSGLEYLDLNGREWHDMYLQEDETVVIAAMRLQHRSHCYYPAVSHRVVSTRESAEEGRFSAVCFMDFHNAKYWDKKGRGRTQDYPPGFFYHMPFRTFDRYFIN